MNAVIAERQAVSPILQESPVVAVLRARTASEYRPVIEALLEGGVRSIELTLSTGGVFDVLQDLVEGYQEAEIGVGTITTVEQAREALDQGARFLVTPVTDLAVIELAASRGVPAYPGGLTPTELHAGWAAGASAVKLFPASAVGPGYISQLRGPFPDMQVLPSGGIDLADIDAWISAGAVAVSVGGPLVQDAFAGGDLKDLTARATLASQRARDARQRQGAS
ncbi:2-keto-3-deoxy-phosphogluconate aldolase [Sinomonas cellulolyticus]|uniref:bifunctional 4-hydroxy-2-oxoglutarate aldolase/2-dehydro-3-deoxy-phosphogluconate aldolase n=1 Tax=Sinomonas cellulolyticus TaxID=2801916 RepID=UPI0019AD2671|nr:MULTISPECIES: bifunctional 4-hydroxy-2-oxoglutarate aldolase/2-dehydro-3-deoxy-phosphogluconate aldolase [Sinomonas]GHG59121.1 2-keto-3-deoxy-phosphogluconate aldolase [Sinomonas sp. KCTC 49339]